MKVRTMKDVEALKKAVSECSRDVWLESQNGEKYDLKDELSQYVAIGALLQDQEERLELFAAEPNDELILMDFLMGLCA